ncbi:ALG6 alpha-1,3-glucosyltransferase garnysstan [Lycorma delicatula]|uniref:ALG6 alpha-1,3-glucosyltransferase garnysstan n=1 Tax=Lycorma delicatula TaxID=130591 RepID=UPI003F511730
MSETRFVGADTLAILTGLFFRWCVSLFSYSGEGKPPMYGDYEAQRHWMELTVNLPITEWYFNTNDNDLLYWGLDYPPLTAYHSFICGYFAKYFNPNFIKLHTSRGYESLNHKFFMRASVFIVDLMTFVPGICLYFSCSKSRKTEVYRSGGGDGPSEIRNKISPTLLIFIALIYPGLLLIDYGHFQYNCVSLGLFVSAVVCTMKNNYVLSSVLFCLALNYKQMELYHSLPFFFYFLGICYNILQYEGFKPAFKLLFNISLSVILSFFIIWLPFIFDVNQISQVIQRLFPLSRGVFEDKVANFWCCFNVFYKIRLFVNNDTMAKICLIDTLFSVLPSSVDLFLNPTFQKFKISLINSSLAFFLFSFQVHEKSILLVAVPVLLYFPQDQFFCFWFLIISTFSMLPLYIKDNLHVPYISLTLFFYFFITSLLDLKTTINSSIAIIQNKIPSIMKKRLFITNNICKVIYYMFLTSMIGCLVLTFIILCLEPPSRYPDLFPLLVSFYSCIHFIMFFLYFNFVQISAKGCIKLKLN